MIKVRAIRCGMVNCYLLEGTDGSVLVDTGTAGSLGKLQSLLADKRLRLILLTHAHGDHAANAAALSRHFGVPVAMSALDEPLLKDPLSRPILARGARGALLRAVSLPQMRFARLERWKNTLPLLDGMQLQNYGIEARVVSLPGHTAGSCGVLTGEGDLIAGDAVMNLPAPGVPLIAEDYGRAEKSVEKIKTLAAGLVYPGHGAPFLAGRL